MPVMSAARTPESRSLFNARALLQTRSLRDLQVPPPPPKSSARDKSRRRVMQVNGPYVVPEVCPPIPGIGEPIRPELVQTPYVRSQSPAASIQVSPFIAATRPSFESDPSQSISPYARSKTRRKAQSSSDARVDKRTMHPATDRETPFPRGEPVYELRDPPIDPRKTRRYCSDFGLGRDELNPPIVARSSPPSPSVPDNSSLASTPLAMYTETETDSDISSVHHALEFSFPQPPSIDESLHLRRMHSSPMFSLEETDAVKDFLRKRWGDAHTSVQKESGVENDGWDSAGDFSNNSGLNKGSAEGLDLERPTIRRVTAESSPGAHKGKPPFPSMPGDRDPSTPATFSSSSGRGADPSWKRSTTTETPRDGGFPLKSSPSSHTRSTSSYRKEANPVPRPTLEMPIITPSQRSIRLPPELSGPLDRLDLSIEKLRAHEPQRLDAAAATWRYQTSSKPQPPLPLSPPSLASAGRQKPTHRSHASAPRAGLGLADVDTLSPISPRGLGAPFNHRTTRSQPAVRVPPQHQEQPMPKSFIDITPEQEIRHEASRTRMRKLLARASIGFIGWGKSLTKKKTISK